MSRDRTCPFCRLDQLQDRVFYRDRDWYAFLDKKPLTPGHTIVARVSAGNEECPRLLGHETLEGIDAALAAVIALLMAHFQPKDVLVASLRGKVPHVHFHLVPLWAAEEQQWRQESGHETGRLWQFLGHLDASQADEQGRERDVLERLRSDVNELRRLAGQSG